MKVYELVSGKMAFPIITKTYIHFDRLLWIWTDLIHQNKLSYESSKSEVIKGIRNHLFYQGITTYSDWYEDTDQTPVLNSIGEKLKPIARAMFPELIKQENNG